MPMLHNAMKSGFESATGTAGRKVSRVDTFLAGSVAFLDASTSTPLHSREALDAGGKDGAADRRQLARVDTMGASMAKSRRSQLRAEMRVRARPPPRAVAAGMREGGTRGGEGLLPAGPRRPGRRGRGTAARGLTRGPDPARRCWTRRRALGCTGTCAWGC